MTIWLWVAVSLLALALLWLGFALAGAVRELAALRDRVAALEADDAGTVHLADGIPIGSTAPSWRLTAADGGEIASGSMRGVRHVVLFADADCRACDELVPDVIDAAGLDRLPPVVIVGRGAVDASPAAWAPRPGRVVVGVERDAEVSEAFGTEVSPHAFVIDEGGFVSAQGGPRSLAEVHALVSEADGLRIVSGAADG